MRILVLLMLVCNQLSAQENLIPNPSFEDSSIATRKKYEGMGEAGRPLCKDWIVPNQSSADFLPDHRSMLLGYPAALAHSGEGRVGIILAAGSFAQNADKGSYKEYVQARFIHPMDSGKRYRIEFYIAQDRIDKHFALNIGAHISKTQLLRNDHFAFTEKPQIVYEERKTVTAEQGWVRVCGEYLSQGGEEWITLGSFDTTRMISMRSIGKKPEKKSVRAARYAYYYLDDVSVIELRENENCKNSSSQFQQWYFLIDASESMNKEGKWNHLPEGIAQGISYTAEGDHLQLYGFNDEVFSLGNDTIAQAYDYSALLQYHPKGATAVQQGLKKIYSEISQHPENTSVVLITDGQFSLGAFKDTIERYYKHRNISFSVLQIGSKNNKSLRKTAERNGGYYLLSDDSEYGREIAGIVQNEMKDREEVNYGKGKFYVTPAFLFTLILTPIIVVRWL
ncbi:MAG: VWA domain-containing protein [Flavobacteriales bacterium]|nr:VWA domain-containing protein [Flavobacteriales bacterium]